MKHIIISVLVLLSIFSCECKKNSVNCIDLKIQQLKNQPVRNPAAKVYSYTYHGQLVYFIPADCCDQYDELYDANCNLLCHPSGGFSGNGDGKCTDFFESRTDEKLIWEDTRK